MNILGKLIAGIIGIIGIMLAIVGFVMAFAVIKNREYFILLGLVVPFLMVFLIIISISYQAIFKPTNKSIRNISAFIAFMYASISMSFLQQEDLDASGGKKVLAVIVIFSIVPVYYLVRGLISSQNELNNKPNKSL